MEVAGPQTNTTGAANMGPGVLSGGEGTVQVSLGATADAFRLRGWNATDIGGAISGNDYFQITVVAAAGYQFTLDSIALLIYDLDTDTTYLDLRSSVDNYTASLGTYATENTTPTGFTKTFTGLAALGAQTNVTFRLYGYSGTGSAYTAQPMIGVFNTNDGRTDLAVNGTVTPLESQAIKATTIAVE
jgi:hypothetical protein